MKFLGINIVLMPNPLKFSITTLSNFQNMLTGINGCSGILKFGINPDQENWFSSKHFFAVSVIALCVSGEDLYFEGGYVSAIAKYSGTLSYPSLGIFNAYCKNPPVTELRDTLKHMNDSWQRLIQTKRFKSGSRFFKNYGSDQGNDADMMAHPHFHALLLVKPSYFRGQGYIKQGDWVEMWQKHYVLITCHR